MAYKLLVQSLLIRASSPRVLSVPSRIQRVLPRASFSTSLRLRETGTVSGQPGSKNLSELGKNAKDEAGKIASDVTSAISGANDRTSQLPRGEGAIESIKGDLSSMGSVAENIPKNALTVGAAGLLPYAGTSLFTIYLSRQAGIAVQSGEGPLDAETALALLHHVELLQIQYGAVILSFLGAIHWGFEFSGYGGLHRDRYLLGIAPVLAGWGSLLLAPQIALVAQWGSFLFMWWADQRATGLGWTPRWYSTYRFWLTAVVGSSILLTLGAANYYGPGDQAFSTTGYRLRQFTGGVEKSELETKQGMKVEKLGNDDDAFVKFTNVGKIREEERKAEEKKRAEEKLNAESRRKEALAK